MQICGLTSDKNQGAMTSATFETTPFAHGRLRNAYRGTWTSPPEIRGRACVVKKYIDRFTWDPADWNETIKINDRAKELANSFNAHIGTSRPITYTDVRVLQVPPSNPYKPNEYVTCEDYIPGNFTKWCSNYGHISSESTSLPAFMHWSWCHTNGEEMVADLQGVRRDDAYLLTDPAILSLSDAYGTTDMGVEGMTMFFLSHTTCSSFCSNLPKPTVAHFDHIIPPHYRQSAQTLLRQLQRSTAYKGERRFPPEIRPRVIAKFREIARQ